MATTTKKREVVKFAPNVPVEVALKYAIPGKVISTQNGERVMFTLADNRVMFLDLSVAKKVDELEVNVQEKFFVCRLEKNGRSEWRVWLSPETEKARAEAVTDNRTSSLKDRARDAGTLFEQQPATIEQSQRGMWGEVGDGTFVIPNGASVAAPAPVQADAHRNGHRASNNGNGSTNGEDPNSKGLARAELIRHSELPLHSAWAESLLEHTVALVDVYAAALSDASSKHGNHVKPEDVRSLLVTVFIQRSKVVSYAA